MRVRVSAAARADLDEISAFLWKRDRWVVERVQTAIFNATMNLEWFPAMGEPGRIEGTYEFKLPRSSIFIVYSRSTTDAGYVDIDRILDERMRHRAD